VLDVDVIEDPAVAAAALDPTRGRLLAALTREPGSASTLAGEVGLTRQKVNYHLRTLEAHGLVQLVEERRRGNFTERVLRATAAAYVISPEALSLVAPHESMPPDQFSARWLIALAARLVRDVGVLLARSTRVGKPLATYAVDTEIAFASAADRAEFARELSACVERLARRHHAPGASGARPHRLVLALHPSITKTPEQARKELP